MDDLDGQDRLPLSSVVITDALWQRRNRPPDDTAINHSLIELSEMMLRHPENLWQELADRSLTLCRAHSAGVSVEEEEHGQKILRWHAVAGAFEPYAGGTMPRDFSPCGVVLDTMALQLMARPDLYFGEAARLRPQIVEALLVPFFHQGKPKGTIWAISHSKDRLFDAEDQRMLSSLGAFATAAYQRGMTARKSQQKRSAKTRTNLKLRRENEQLRDEIRQREESENQLRQRINDLEQFALSASHDLHEPLRTIGLYTELLRTRVTAGASGNSEPLFHTIVDTASRMRNLLDDLLQYAQLGAQAPTPSFSPVCLREALGDALDGIRALLQAHRAVVTEEGLPTVIANRALMTLVFQNLINNAIKYRRLEEAPRVHVSARHEAGNWIVSVSDNGEGFPPESAEEIFRYFKRLHGREIPGTGMGLALCRRALERHGGKIEAASIPGSGSVFSFTLPAARLPGPETSI